VEAACPDAGLAAARRGLGRSMPDLALQPVTWQRSCWILATYYLNGAGVQRRFRLLLLRKHCVASPLQMKERINELPVCAKRVPAAFSAYF
jgi:hypothetical protein